MTTEQIEKWLHDSSLLNEESLLQLEFLVTRYPLFQIVRLLYLKNLHTTDPETYYEQLPQHALFIQDRDQLYQYIEMDIPLCVQTTREKKNESFEKVETFLKAVSDPVPPAPPMNEASKKAMATQDYATYFLSDTPDTEVSLQSELKLKHHDLVDKYLLQAENEGVFKPTPFRKDEPLSPLPSEKEPTQEPESEGFFTESLAKIYVQQKKYDKALKIIRQLSLNYPEKSAYFADQIRYLQILINNIKH